MKTIKVYYISNDYDCHKPINELTDEEFIALSSISYASIKAFQDEFNQGLSISDLGYIRFIEEDDTDTYTIDEQTMSAVNAFLTDIVKEPPTKKTLQDDFDMAVRILKDISQEMKY